MNCCKFWPILTNYLNSITISRTKIRCFCYSNYHHASLLTKTKLLLSNNHISGQSRFYSSEKENEKEEENKPQTSEAVFTRTDMSNYEIFQDKDSPIILDIDEERRMLLENPELLQEMEAKEKKNQFFGLNLDRGENGVFEINELVTILRNDNASNVVTIAIPPEFRYVDYMVIVSGRSFKHLYSMAEFVRQLFKKKRYNSDRLPEIEGMTLSSEKPSGWLAMDLGNIALHLFLEPVRLKYDLETLWSVGREYDDQYNAKSDDYIALLEQHTLSSLDDLIPDEKTSTTEQEKLA